MKNLLLGFAVLFSMSVTAQNLRTPAPSTTQTITQDFALSSIEINYSRPSAKGRTVFGGLVPYSEKWRTGANGPTTVSFGQDVTVGGKAVKAGKYSLLTVPGKSSWEVMLCKDNMSVFNFKEENVVTRFYAEALTLPFPVETFTIMISDVTNNTANIQLIWADQVANIKVSTDIDSDIMGQIDNAMNKDNRPYFAAASYYYDNGKDINKTIEWANKAADAQPDAYWVRHLVAKANAKAGNKAAAIAAANKSMELAKAADNMDYVRLNENLLKGL
jgi:hypothetical protein